MSPLLLTVGFVAGLLTMISPCILPVLPAVIASGVTTGGARRALAIATGLAITFGVVELFSFRVLEALHLPLDLREDIAIAVLAIVGLGMLVPRIGELVERPFARLGFSRAPDRARSGFGLGATLGLLYLPCAGPILGAIATVGNSSQSHITADAVGLTVAYCIGIAMPMFVLILLTSRVSTGTTWLRSHQVGLRRVGGALILVSAIVVATGAATTLQTKVPSYTTSIENNLSADGSVSKTLSNIRNPNESVQAQHIQQAVAPSSTQDEFSASPQTTDMADQIPTVSAASLRNYGPAPDFADVTQWLNTNGASPTISSLRGQVVLIDFWTYSCINCLRSLPHVTAWYSRYHADGLEVIGVHTPEFDFEHSVSNVSDAVQRLGITYPVDIDNNYGTWSAWGNNSWPAEYLIDRDGDVRYGSIGEGDYGQTEASIRALLATNGKPLPPATDVPDTTPTDNATPESYLGYKRLARYVGSPIKHDSAINYTPASSVASNELSYAGNLDVQSEDIVAGQNAAIELNYTADDVYLVLSGTGTATVSRNGVPIRTVDVSGVPALYTLISGARQTKGLLKVTLSPGLKAYDFTFG